LFLKFRGSYTKIKEDRENIKKKKSCQRHTGEFIRHTHCLNNVKKFYTRQPVFHLDNILYLLKDQIYLIQFDNKKKNDEKNHVCWFKIFLL